MPSAFFETGMPPPPTAMTTTSWSRSRRMVSCSRMEMGLGEATTRRQPRPASSLSVQPFSAW